MSLDIAVINSILLTKLITFGLSLVFCEILLKTSHDRWLAVDAEPPFPQTKIFFFNLIAFSMS